MKQRMVLHGVSKAYGSKVILNKVSMTLDLSRNLGVLGSNGAGKSTLLRMLAGIEQPDEGHIERIGSVSWPIGFSGAFNGSLSGEENSRFVARIYERDIGEVLDYARSFSELADDFYRPVRTYSSGMRSRLAFGLSMAIDFEIYLVDEVTAVGDQSFRKKCNAAFQQRQQHASLVIVSHGMNTIRQHCDRCLVLRDGNIHRFDNLDEGMRFYA